MEVQVFKMLSNKDKIRIAMDNGCKTVSDYAYYVKFRVIYDNMLKTVYVAGEQE